MNAIIDRIRAKTNYVGDCWVWAGRLGFGYGVFSVNGKSKRTHRVAYEILVGPVPEGLVLDHLCRNRACWNPTHLEPVTHRENLLRGETHAARNAAKTHCPQGHPYNEANTIHRRSGRRCRACHNARTGRPMRRRRQANTTTGDHA